MSNHIDEAKKVIERLGGGTKTAAICEVTKSAVSQWLLRGIPKTQLKFLRLARPDAFPEAAKAKRRRAPASPP